MAAQIPADVAKFMREYEVAADEIWPVPGGKSYAIKHSALERIANARKIEFQPPTIIESDGANGVATIVVTAVMDDIIEWSFGEASPRNNKNAYPFAMAEKRGKDRCILKLLKAHGAIYSEDEAEDFKPQRGARIDEISVYLARAKTAILNEETRDGLISWWKSETEARATLRLKPGVPEYDELFSLYREHGACISQKHKEAAE